MSDGKVQERYYQQCWKYTAQQERNIPTSAISSDTETFYEELEKAKVQCPPKDPLIILGHLTQR